MTFWRLAGKHYRQTIENHSHSSGVANRRYIPDSRGRVGMATKETKAIRFTSLPALSARGANYLSLVPVVALSVPRQATDDISLRIFTR